MLPWCILASGLWLPAVSQAADPSQSSVNGIVPSRVPSRVMETIDDAKRVTLAGNTLPKARAQFETGRLEPGLPFERMMLVLKRSPEQDAALQSFHEHQYDPASADFHHWLHAEEFGELYGPSDADIAAVSSWLETHGFRIEEVNQGRTIIQFSGSAAQVEQAFQVEMHRYLINGERHIANDRDPSIPAALAPVVSGIASLNDFFAKPQHVIGKTVWIDRKTGSKTPIEARPSVPGAATSAGLAGIDKNAADTRPTPQLTYQANGDTYEELTPYDFATIYNILPLWTASTPVNGKGVTIAISGVSDINPADFNHFRSSFGLPASTLKTIVNGSDPGADGGGGQEENSLDVEMAGATAPGAQIVLVVSAGTATTGADLLSDEYIIDKEVAPIMSGSYGECEPDMTAAQMQAYNAVWQQGATEGISIFESAGDQGSAGCSNSDTPGPNADSFGLAVNGIASSPYLTAVGGTDFTWSFTDNGTATYWNSTDGPELQTAKGIIPEVPWNSTCTNPELDALFGAANPENLCNGLIDYDNGFFDGLIVITGGSGGTSTIYTKPTWQTGYGSSSKYRDLPDVSLFASAGFPSTVNGSGILFCDSVASGSCNYTSVSGIEAQEVGGTSASSPLLAGIMALVDQTQGAQGLANPTLYKLFAKQVAAGTDCNSSTVTNGNSCYFYDVCFTGDLNCVTDTTGHQLGILSGYAAKTGYDDATGLGTLNVTNLVKAWPSVTTTYTVSLSPTTLTFASTTEGSTSAAQTVTVKNTGTGTVTLTSETITGTGASSFVKSATTCGAKLTPGATCTVSVEFKPAATGTLTASLSIADNAKGTPQTVALTGTAVAPNTVTLTPTSIALPNTVTSTTSQAQVVTLKNTGSVTTAISSIALGGANPTSFVELSGCGSSLAAGASCNIYVAFAPASAAALSATLSVKDTATGSPQTVTLTGTGTSAPSVKLSTAGIAFPTTKHGTTSEAQPVTLTNGGTATLALSSITLTGANPTDFEALNTCGPTLAAGASCTVYVAFKPATAAAFKATLSIADSGSSSPQSVALSGTGN